MENYTEDSLKDANLTVFGWGKAIDNVTSEAKLDFNQTLNNTNFLRQIYPIWLKAEQSKNLKKLKVYFTRMDECKADWEEYINWELRSMGKGSFLNYIDKRG